MLFFFLCKDWSILICVSLSLYSNSTLTYACQGGDFTQQDCTDHHNKQPGGNTPTPTISSTVHDNSAIQEQVRVGGKRKKIPAARRRRRMQRDAKKRRQKRRSPILTEANSAPHGITHQRFPPHTFRTMSRNRGSWNRPHQFNPIDSFP